MNASTEQQAWPWWTDSKNIFILCLLVIIIFVSGALAIGTWSVTHAPTSYELRSDADTSFAELRDRINSEVNSQQIISTNITNEFADDEERMDQMADDINQILSIERLPTRQPYKHKSKKH